MTSYALANGNTIDVYLPAPSPTNATVPVVIYVHGGYWYKGSVADAADLCADQVSHGRACFSVSYRLVPTVTWPTPLVDVRAGVAWVRAHATHFRLDVAHSFIVGSSAGGLMATIAGLTDGHFAGILDISGVVDTYHAFRSPSQQVNPATATNTLALFAGVKPYQNWPLWQTARAITYAAKTAKVKTAFKAPILIMHGTRDRTINIEMSDDFRTELVNLHWPTTYDRIAKGPHALGATAYPDVDKWVSSKSAKH